VDWSVHGVVRQLQVRGTNTGTVQVILPLDRSACPAIARRMKLPANSCAGRQLSMSSPVQITWSSPQFVASSQLKSRQLDITPHPRPRGSLGMIVRAQTRLRPSVCFAPAKTVTLRLSGSSGRYTKRIIANGTFRCDGGAGLALLIGQGRGGSPPAFEFDGVRYLGLEASAQAASLEGFTGRIMLSPGPKTNLVHPTPVSLRAVTSGPLKFDVELNISNPVPAGQRPPLVTSRAVTSVSTDSGELVPSEWDRDPGVIVPIFGGLVSVLVLTPLAASMRAIFHALNRRMPRIIARPKRWMRWLLGLLKRVMRWLLGLPKRVMRWLIRLLKRRMRRFRARASPVRKTRKERHAP
jgi:hypothetical protein